MSEDGCMLDWRMGSRALPSVEDEGVGAAEQAVEICRRSGAMIGTGRFRERSYLSGLGRALGMGAEGRERGEAEVAGTKRDGAQ